ncbi:carboxymuconolactone decarboxylase family protein [Gordonia amarae]|uniref:Carboxymuconolactone decarboxylase family protein n=2 Tax=Gordonia amarae TaxID=36821 RepID=G7GQ44_9ACTN|nr:carboxymuconolactone decarboxylase family protein [Gordonia amarae]MCS3876778.1 AhpD family alkylhydroperoxidase [Gordonia amarae]QHN15624.1 carboxymuconolactone decarboxylase family protein [Gordonia amarae]QHN20193.1 carboxymuconolactone decarboxylase family protein [Gordonia amarae]QHN29044.1 carboxymuconolactone decarboxylase family protein [Gordonia amarae]QHN37825.1 carboxymuconolactone decarboxylase family protein [Gordonia amarae]
MTTPTRPQADRPPFLDKTNPDVFAALGDVAGQVSDACEAAGLDRVDIELLNVAISQRNGCAYCTDLHTRRARKAGADQQLLDALPVWGESALFTDRQRAILDLGLTITSLPSPRRRRRAIRAGRRHLTVDQLAAVEWSAILMNAFNRVSIMSEHPVKRRSTPKNKG